MPIEPGRLDSDPSRIFCFKYTRTVAMDNTVRFGNRRIQLLPGSHRISYAKCRVEVHERLDGRIAVFHQSTRLILTEAPLEATRLRTRGGLRAGKQPLITSGRFDDRAGGATKPELSGSSNPSERPLTKRLRRPSGNRPKTIPGGASA